MENNKLLNNKDIIPDPVTPIIYLPIEGEIMNSLKADGFIEDSTSKFALNNPFLINNDPKITIRNRDNNQEDVFADNNPVEEDEITSKNQKQMNIDQITNMIFTKLNKLTADSGTSISIPALSTMDIEKDANYLINNILPIVKVNLTFDAGIMIFFDAEFFSGGNEKNIFRDKVLSFPKKSVGFWRIYNFDTFIKQLKTFFLSFEKRALEASDLTGSNVRLIQIHNFIIKIVYSPKTNTFLWK